MVQKVCCGETRSVPADSHNHIDIGEVLPVQLDSVDAGEFDIVMPQYACEIVDACFVRLVSAFETGPSEGLWCLSSQSQLGIFFKGCLFDDH